MQVRHLDQSQQVLKIAESKVEERPPLEEIVESLALLAALHAGAVKPEATPVVARAEDDESAEDDKDKPKPESAGA